MSDHSSNPSDQTLSGQICDACRHGAPKATAQEQEQWLSELDNWLVVDKKGVLQLLKAYEFDNFMDALAFAQQVGELAEECDHHPALLVEWGRVTVRWWTHKIKGLHKNDFIMAAKTDLL